MPPLVEGLRQDGWALRVTPGAEWTKLGTGPLALRHHCTHLYLDDKDWPVHLW